MVGADWLCNLEAISGLLWDDRYTNVRARVSQDLATNKWGKTMMSLCSAADDLLILYGRLSGNTQGRCTYGSKAQENADSLVDYVICTPGLVFSKDGLCSDIL